MAKTGTLWSRTRLAAISSCVDSGFDAQSTTSAPPSRRQMARFAVSAVTCRQAEMRIPFSGWFLMNSFRMICRTFIDWFAHSMRSLPRSASSMFLMSQLIAAVDILFTLLASNCQLAADEFVARFAADEDYSLMNRKRCGPQSIFAEYAVFWNRSGCQ